MTSSDQRLLNRGNSWAGEEAEKETRFSYDDVPQIVVELLNRGQVDRGLDEAIRHGDNDSAHLSDLVFFQRFPDREGRYIRRTDSDYATTSQAWLKIRSSTVASALERAVSAQRPSRSPCYPEPTRKGTSVARIKRVWIFYEGVPTKTENVARFVANVLDFEVTDVVLEINSGEDSEFGLPDSKTRALEALAVEFCHVGVDLHLMAWLRPTSAYLKAAATALRSLCERTGVRSLLFDVEEPWTRNTDEARAERLLQQSWTFDDWPCRLGATGITMIPDSIRPVVSRCNYVLPQAYSIARSESVYSPGRTQRIAFAKWEPFKKPVVMGLAAYDLKRPREKGSHAPNPLPSETTVMQTALVTAENLGVSEVAYWSLLQVRKEDAKERAAFVRQAALKARAGVPQSRAQR